MKRICASGALTALALLAGVAPVGTSASAASAASAAPAAPAPDPYSYAGVLKAAPKGLDQGVGGVLQISDPLLHSPKDQVTNEISIVRGDNESLVEVGYRKFRTGGPTLMVGRWAGGNFLDTDKFRTTHKTNRPDMRLDRYVGKKVRFAVQHRKNAWWVWFDNAWLGYYPDSLWQGRFTSGDTTHWYGEVFSPARPPLSQMGNGRHARDTRAEAIDGMCQYDTVRCVPIKGGVRNETSPRYYSLQYAGGSSQRHGGTGAAGPGRCARPVGGAIGTKWRAIGGFESRLRCPLAPSKPTPGRKGYYQHFQGGSLYWSPASGAHPVQGAIRTKWASLGWERGRLGFPTSDERKTTGARAGERHGVRVRQTFQGGVLIWDSHTRRVTEARGR
ncbi:neprosin family prolyl endopeptidase [Streptomyces mesophilus]|uniref:neprosin family prolyl endopeptidase n=1 Tax=Streptomyces mesophilus TaxID=1775132 RepID=UPI00331EAEEF